MISFLTRLFAVVGFLLVLVISGIIGIAYYNADRPKPEPKSIVLVLPFDEAITEQNQPSPLDFALHEESHALPDILHAIDVAKKDPNVKAIVGRFGSGEPGLTQDQEIRAALAKFRESGKPMYSFATSYGEFGAGDRSYYLASAFDNIWLQPYGSVGLTGLAVQMPFVKTALEKVGVTAEFLKREEYKSAMDNVTRDEFAPQVKVETQAMIENLQAQVADGIAESRKMKSDDVKQLMANGPYTDTEALKANLITRIGYADELEKEITDKAGKDVSWLSVEDYISFEQPKNGPTGTKVALIYGEGLITDKAEGPSAIPGEEKEMGADQIEEAFRGAAEDRAVKAILFRIDSPGGSPEASETIRRAMLQAQKKGKPVIVSMGDVAASGGYWVAMNADRIVAEPGTLTGSIGVFAGKFNIGGLLKKFDINWETLRTTDAAGMWSMLDGFSPPQRARIDALLDETYHAFMTNVSDARKIPMEKMPDVAKGRVFTGDQAIKVGLVDQLGGYEAAYGALRESMKLDKDAPLNLQVFPAPETPIERLKKVLKNFGVESAAMNPFLGEWQKMASMLGFAHQMSAHPVEMISPEAAFATVK